MEQTATFLYYREGSSDKVYNVRLIKKGNGYVVDFEYGRRGATLKVGTKTPKPVALKKAEEIYNELVAEKKTKGYENINLKTLLDGNEEDENTANDVNLVKELVGEESFSELDFELQSEFGFDYDNGGEFNVTQKDNAENASEDATPIKVDDLLEALQKLKKKGATHVQLEHHGDHIGYDISGWKIKKASDKDVANEKKKVLKQQVKQEKIQKLRKQIEEIENE